MVKFALHLDVHQIEQIISQMKAKDRIALLQRLERKSWRERFCAITHKIDQRRKKYPITPKQVRQFVKEARKERYEAGRS